MMYKVALDFFNKPVKDFTEALTIYEDEGPDTKIDTQAIMAYSRAVTYCKEWIRSLLLTELEQNTTYDTARCVLKLPDKDIEIAVSVKYSDKDEGFWGTCTPELINTPIGLMDEWTLTHLHEIKDNPIQLFYSHLGALTHHIHNLLTDAYPVLNDEILSENNIQDPLHLHKMDTILWNIDEFFDRIA